MGKTVAPPNLSKILAGLGITQDSLVKNARVNSGRNVSTARVASFGGNIVAARQAAVPRPSLADAQAHADSAPGGTNGTPGALPWKPSMSLTGTAPTIIRDSTDMFTDFVGDVFTTGLRTVDAPRAMAVSAVKELGDAGYDLYDRVTGSNFGENSDPSLGEFYNQAKDGVGYGDVWRENTGGGSGNEWVDRAVGFAGDVALDPLTYLAPGTGAVGGAETATGTALREAISQGGRREISTALLQHATEVGVKSEAVDALVSGVARRGRGGLTQAAIQRAGLSAEEAAALDLPRLAKTIGRHGPVIAGTGTVADGLEAFKGAVKESLGATKAAEIFRKVRVPETDALLKMTNVVRGRAASTEERMAAIAGIATINAKKNAGFGAAATAVREMANSDWAKAVKHADDNVVADIIHQIELGKFDGVAGDIHKFMDDLYAKAKAAGVEVPYRSNYMPHIVTDEAYKLGKKNARVKAIIDEVGKEVGFQSQRADARTIREINQEFMSQYGVKLFSDDMETVLTHYIADFGSSIGRAAQTAELKRLGYVTAREQIAKVVSEPLDEDMLRAAERLAKDRETQLAAQGQALSSADAVRRNQLQSGIDAIKARRAQLGQRLHAVQSEMVETGRVKVLAETELANAERNVAALEAAKEVADRAATGGRQKAAYGLRMEAKRVTAELDAAREALVDAQNHVASLRDAESGLFQSADGGTMDAAPLARPAEDEVVALQGELARLQRASQEIRTSMKPLGSGVGPDELAVSEAARSLETARATAGAWEHEADVAAHTFDVVFTENSQLIPMIESDINDLSRKLGEVGGRQPRKSTKIATQVEVGLELKRRADSTTKLLLAHDDPAAQLLLHQSAVADMADMLAWQHGRNAADMQKMVDVLRTPKFHDEVSFRLREGYQAVGDQFEIPEWVADLTKFEKVIGDPSFFKDAAKFYDSVMNVWKGYAIARPGFIARNTYSSLFNVYLEGGIKAAGSLKDFHKFYQIYKKDPVGYLDAASAVFKNPETVSRLDQALQVVAGTGGGLAHEEFQVGLMHGLSAKPWSKNFAPIRGIRHANEEVEALIRGGHAFDILQRGASQDLATQTIEKWHFNYRDLTDFDRAAKRVIPFWTFFSRDLALQAQTFVPNAAKLNRTYYNLQRNLSLGEPEDQNVPDYMDSNQFLQLPGGDPNGTVNYLQLDLPSVKFQQTIQDLGTPSKFVSQMAPAIKLPVEMFGNKQTFSGIPFRNDYSTFDENGSRVSRGVPWWAKFPGMAQVLNATGMTEQYADGTPSMTDKTQYVVESLFPPLGQVSRMVDATKGGRAQIAWGTGLSVRANTAEMRASAVRRQKALEAAAKAASKDLGYGG